MTGTRSPRQGIAGHRFAKVFGAQESRPRPVPFGGPVKIARWLRKRKAVVGVVMVLYAGCHERTLGGGDAGWHTVGGGRMAEQDKRELANQNPEINAGMAAEVERLGDELAEAREQLAA